MNEPTTDTLNPYASLGTTDRVSLPGADLEQRGESLRVDVTDGARLTLGREITGCALLRVYASDGQRVVVSLPPELAVRLGSHLAALGAETLAPAEEPAA